MTFCLKSVEIQSIGMFINGYYFIVRCGMCTQHNGGLSALEIMGPRLNVSQALNGSSWILRVHLNGVGARHGLCDCCPYLLDHFHWKLVSPKDLQTLEGHQNVLETVQPMFSLHLLTAGMYKGKLMG